MDDALRIIQNCRDESLMINPSKTTAKIFTRIYKPEAIKLLNLWGKELTYANSIEILESSWIPN